MKIQALILAVALALPVFSHAEDAPKKKSSENFQKHKEEMLKHMDQRIADMTALKTCVAGAADHEAMKNCHRANEKKMKEMRAAHHGHGPDSHDHD